MITSWADEDEDSEDGEKSSAKKAKKPAEVRKPPPKPPVSKRPVPEPKAEVCGPHLPPEILKHRRILDGLATSRRNQAAAGEQAEEDKSQLLQKLRRLKAESNAPEEAKEKVLAPGMGRHSTSSSNSSSRSNSPDTASMISHLKRQAQLLKEHVDTPANGAKKDTDDIIKLIEMEQPPDHSRPEKKKIETSSAIALIAGYGDDSEGEDDALAEDVSAKKPAPSSSLFPIMQHASDIQNFVETQKTEKPEHKPEVPEPKPSFVLETNPLLESGGGVKRKKRLAVPTRPISQVQSSDEIRSQSKSPELGERTNKSCVVLGNVDSERSVSASEYTMKWSSSYASDPSSSEHRGFGFQESNQHSSDQHKGKVLFVKAETINDKDPSADDKPKRPVFEKDTSKTKGK